MRDPKLRPLICWIVAVTIILALPQRVACRASAAISDCIDATCRITTADGSRGTGCVFEIGGDRVYVLTAAHVVGASRSAQCEFWRHGHQSQPIPGRVILRIENDDCDAAILALDASQFGGVLPTAIPVAPRDHCIRPGATLVSVGCAKGAWSTGWKGHALGYRGADLRFTPTPADGRSGSAIFDADATRIVGLLRARTIDGSEGIACSLQSLYRNLSATAGPKNTQCGPGGCPVPGINLLPYRNREPYRAEGPQQQVWPTLPGPAPSTAGADLSETNQRLDQIAQLLLEIKIDRTRPAEAMPPEYVEPPKTADDDRESLQLAQSAADDVARLGTRLDTTEESVGGLQTVVKAWIAEHGSLKERMETRLEKVREQLGEEASQREVRIAYLKDLITEKLTGGGAVGLLKLLGLPAGLIVAAWLVSRRVERKREAGEPLLIEKLFADVGELKGRLHNRIHPDPSQKDT